MSYRTNCFLSSCFILLCLLQTQPSGNRTTQTRPFVSFVSQFKWKNHVSAYLFFLTTLGTSYFCVFHFMRVLFCWLNFSRFVFALFIVVRFLFFFSFQSFVFIFSSFEICIITSHLEHHSVAHPVPRARRTSTVRSEDRVAR